MKNTDLIKREKVKDYVIFALSIILPLYILSVNKDNNSVYYYILVSVLLIKAVSCLIDQIFAKIGKTK